MTTSPHNEVQPSGAGGLRERRRQATRTALFEAAMSLFEQRGYSHVTIEEICGEADVSPRTFFRYFRSKDDILLTHVTDALDLVLADLRSRPEDEDAWPALVAAVTGFGTRIEAERVASVRSWRVLQESPETLGANARVLLEWDAAMSASVAARLGRAENDLRSRVLTGAAMTAFRVAFDDWARRGGTGSLLDTLDEALEVIAAGHRRSGG